MTHKKLEYITLGRTGNLEVFDRREILLVPLNVLHTQVFLLQLKALLIFTS